jgi:hypothetical protein
MKIPTPKITVRRCNCNDGQRVHRWMKGMQFRCKDCKSWTVAPNIATQFVPNKQFPTLAFTDLLEWCNDRQLRT